MDYKELIRNVRARPILYGLDESYGSLQSFFLGCDVGSRGEFLLGFREWLIVKTDGGNNLSWPGLVQRVRASAGESSGYRELSDTDALLALIDEFLEIRQQDDGHLKIFARYADWLREQAWFRAEMLDLA
ncbi:hypothetical protein ACFTSF_20470 [Kribbella sp. NPDC056951]|uniref:hypothetical protein n=1 Tax=Kribbella sp. NPDC056951 TaxID=3345978 RepID=UPI00362BBD4B